MRVPKLSAVSKLDSQPKRPIFMRAGEKGLRHPQTLALLSMLFQFYVKDAEMQANCERIFGGSEGIGDSGFLVAIQGTRNCR
jgi:hypothetical protein